MSKILTTAAAMDAASQLIRSAVDRRITKVRPMATPIDQISRLAGTRHVGAMEVAYYTIDAKGGATTMTSMANVPQPDPENPGSVNMKIKVADTSIFEPSDTVMFPRQRLADNSYLTGYVTAVSEKELSVAVLDAYSGDIESGDPVVRMGRAATELDVQTAQYQVVPKRKTNYCQIFKMQVEQSTLMQLADKEVAWTLNEQEEAAVIDMRLGMEKTFLFGRKAMITDPNKHEPVYLTQGIWGQAGSQATFDVDNPDVDDFISLAREVFTGNNGSRKRLLIGGSDFVAAISKMKFSDKVVVGQMHSKWGLETREISTNFGSLYVLHSEVFDQCGHEKDGFVLDQAFLTKYSHIPFTPEKLDLRAAGTRNTDAVVLTEASCLVLRNPTAHFRVVHKA